MTPLAGEFGAASDRNLPSAAIILTPAGHTLVSEDGATLLQILNELYDAEPAEADQLT